MNDKQKIEYFKSVLTPINVLQDLYQLIFDFHNVSQLVKFPYVTDGGVLLGSLKYGTIIRYDDDFDCCYISNEENNKKLEMLFHFMRKLEYKVFRQIGHGGYQIVSQKINNYYPFIDVIPLYEHNDKYYYFARITHNNPKFKNWIRWKKSQLFPRKLIPIGDFKIWGPNKPEKYLDQNYPDWRTISEYQGHHTFNNALSLVLEYYSEQHPRIESKKLPIDVQRAPKMKLKYDTFKQLDISPELLCKRKWYFIFKSSQWRWLRFNNVKCQSAGLIDQ
jgi:hypothetical protein